MLIDARQGVLEQSRRHAFIASLLRVPHIVASSTRWTSSTSTRTRSCAIEEDFRAFARRIGADDARRDPALRAARRQRRRALGSDAPGTTGRRCSSYLEERRRRRRPPRHAHARLPVQYVVRPHDDAHHDYRGYAGRVAGGHAAGRRRRRRAARAARARGGRRSTRSTARSTRPCPADVRDGRAWPTTSTSPAGRSSRAPPTRRRSCASSSPTCAGSTTGRCGPAGATSLKPATRTTRATVADAPARDRRRHARARHRRDLARAQRHRPGAPAHRRAGGAGPVRRQPRDGRVHPHRRAHERDGGGRHGRGAGEAAEPEAGRAATNVVRHVAA